MKKNYLLFCFLFFGMSSIFAQSSLNMELVGQLDYSEGLSDIWGFEQQSTNTEYAIVGVYDGTSIVSLADPTQPVEVAFIPGAGTIWRDMKVWEDVAYVTNEGDDGLLIIDLSGLTNQVPSVQEYWWTGQDDPNYPMDMQTAHNVFIDEKGYAYILGSNVGVGGAIILDLNENPLNPPVVGIYDQRYIHDAYVKNDLMWAAEINDGILSAVDLSDRSNPVVLGFTATPNDFAHNVWASTDGKHVFTTDEVSGGFIGSYNVEDVTDIKEVDRIQSSPGSGVIPHNSFVRGNFIITSYYRDGVTIHDATFPDFIVEVGHYDTAYDMEGDGFNGCWGVYPYLPSGLIIASDIEKGLFVLQPEYIQAAYLGGTATDSETGAPLFGVTVSIDDLGITASTDLTGDYQTGTTSTGLYTVTYSKPGYEPFLITLVFENGIQENFNVELIPLPTIAIDGSVIDDVTSEAVNNAQVLIYNDEFTYEVTTDENGNFTVPNFLPGSYEIVAGQWGYNTNTLGNNEVDAEFGAIVLELTPGYYDDFNLDFGWTVSGNALSGIWERGVPIGTSYQGQICNPDVDVPGDLGSQCYITGNGGGGAGFDDVDDGTTILTSPVFDLSNATEPYLSYERWFFNDGGNGSPNDELTVTLDDGTDTYEIEVYDDQEGWAINLVRIRDYTDNLSNLQIAFEISDEPNTGHLVEAGIDWFYTFDAAAITGIANDLTNEVQAQVHPNPFTNMVQIDLAATQAPLNCNFQLFDLTGRLVHQEKILGNSLQVKRQQSWPAGLYQYQIVANGNKVQAGKLVIQD